MDLNSFPNCEGEQMRLAWVFVALAGTFGLAESRGDSEPAKLTRGGLVTETRHYRFEVYFYGTGMRVFPERSGGTPLAVSGLAGTTTFYHPNSPKPWFSRPLRAAPSASSLDLAIGLGDAPTAGVKVTIAVNGLPEPSEPAATFTVPLKFVAASASGGIVASTQPARPLSDVSPLFPSADGLMGYRGFGDLLPTRHGPTSPLTSTPTVSLYGYGRVPAASPGGPLPYVSGHGVFIMPSAGRDMPLARPWLRPMD
jgi:hypothetical protein